MDNYFNNLNINSKYNINSINANIKYNYAIFFRDINQDQSKIFDTMDNITSGYENYIAASEDAVMGIVDMNGNILNKPELYEEMLPVLLILVKFLKIDLKNMVIFKVDI